MAIQDWIDAQADVWRTVSCQGFNTVKCPYMVKDGSKYPEAINPKDDFPIALINPRFVIDPEYSMGGVIEDFFAGSTYFHVAPDLSMTRLPNLWPWIYAIKVAAAAHMQLGGLVSHFVINKQGGIVGPTPLQYGDEAEHWGFIVNWTVKEKYQSGLVVGK